MGAEPVLTLCVCASKRSAEGSKSHCGHWPVFAGMFAVIRSCKHMQTNSNNLNPILTLTNINQQPPCFNACGSSRRFALLPQQTEDELEISEVRARTPMDEPRAVCVDDIILYTCYMIRITH